jgi:hypothetical protein
MRSEIGRRQKRSPEFTTIRPRPPQQYQKSLPSQFGQKCDIKKAGNNWVRNLMEENGYESMPRSPQRMEAGK